MTSTYNNPLRLTEIGNGEQSGTWGTTTNNNLGVLICDAIAGVQAIALGTSTSYTLTSYQGVADESRNAVLEFSGSPASTVTVTCPNTEKTYTVKNGTAQSITFTRTSGGGTVSVPAGATALIYCDGTDFKNGINYLPASSTLGGVDIVTTSGSQTLTNKTLTSPALTTPKVTTSIQDSAGNALIAVTGGGTANYLTVANASGTASPSITATGSDTNIDVLLVPKGSGVTKSGGVEVVTLTGTQTLSNKTLTAPKFADLGFIADANGNELIVMDTVASAVNEIKIANAATAGTPTIAAQGGDTNVSLNLVTKGTGTLQYNGTQIATISDLPSTSVSTQSAQTGTAYTLVLADAGKTVTMNNASANTLTVPTNASVAFPTGTRIDVLQLGAGQTSIVGDTGVTVFKYNIASGTTAKIAGQYAAATLWKQGTNTWYLVGNLTT